MGAGVQASTWLPTSRARALRAWRRDQLILVEDGLQRALDAWCRDWGVFPPAMPLACEPWREEAAGDTEWHALRADSGPPGAWLCAPADAELLAAFGMGPVARGVRAACLHDAAARVAIALGLPTVGDAEPSGPPADLVRPWAGAVCVRLHAPGHWLLVIGAEALQAVLQRGGGARPPAGQRAARQALVPIGQALATRPLPLQVRLDGCELDLGALQSLARGDVVRLRHVLTQPAHVTDGDGRACLAGYLASRGPRKALALTGPSQ
jgi:hypothetical protein